MYNLSVLQVVDPSCFFCEILKESDSKEYEQLFAELNFLYSTVYRDVEELKPASLPVGTFCVVLYEKMKSWCRAILESTTCSAQDELVDCFLLDYALYCPIKKTNIRFPVDKCQKLPFRARKFKLHHIQPISLCINVFENKSELRPAKSWDTAAIHYFKQLLNESLKIEAQLCSVEGNCTGVYLYLTTADSVICANDDLVAKKYACYENGNPKDKTENGKVVISSAQTLQNGCMAIPLTEEQPQPLVSVPGQAVWQKISSLNQATDLAEKIVAHKREAVVRRRSTDSQNEKPLVSLRVAHQHSASEVMSPQPKESRSCNRPRFKPVTSPDPFLHPAWCKADPGQTLQTDAAKKLTAEIRGTTVQPSKNAMFLQSQKENPSNSVSKEHKTSVFENVGTMSPQDQHRTSSDSPKFKVVTSPDPILRPVWSKADPARRLHTEVAENTIAGIRETAVHPRKDALPLHRQKESISDSASKEHKTSVFESAGTMSPQNQQHTSSDSPTFKLVTSPDPVLHPVWSKTDPAQKLHTEVAENTIADLRKFVQTHVGMIRSPHDTSLVREEKPNQTVQGKLQTPESDSKVESDPAQFVWPAWSKRDVSRRLSTEITEKSFAKLSLVGEKKPEPKDVDKKQGLTRLLHFLSPTPRQLPEVESRKPPNITKPERAIFASKRLAPFSTLEETSLCAAIKKRLIACGYDGPHLTESYCWAPIADGFDTIVITPDGSNPIYYMPPLLTYLLCASVAYKLLPAKHGPHAVIICPGWNKAHAVYNLLMEFSKYTRPLSPMLLLVGLKKEDIESINFRKQCEVIVTTPHSLLRCLAHHGLLLLRLCHLVFDEADTLFSKAGSEMSEILQIYKKIVTVENRDGIPQQIVAVGSKWIHDMQLLLQYTSAPHIVITRIEQAAVFANVQQVIQLCLDYEKMSVLLQCLDFTPVNAQKILIFTKNDEEAELVHKAVQTASVYSLLLHKSIVHNFSHVLEQWKKVFSGGTVVVLVVTDDYAPLLEITDATCIIHYSFPENVGVLSLRLFSLLDYIQCKIDKISTEEDDYSRAKSVFLMTEKHASCAIDLLKSLQQAQAIVPPELIALAQGLLQAWENKKQDQELCPYLKTFGHCNQDEYACPYRHRVNPSLDLPGGVAAIPESDQCITVLPLCILDAARFLGRVVTKNDPYDKLAAELNEYYQSTMNKVQARKVECKQLYAISDGSEYHRVKVLSTKTMNSVSYAHVQFVDDGKTDEIPVHMMFLLPPAFQSVPPQFREFIVCRVKPIDNEDKWDPKVKRIITRSIRGKKHRAKVVLNLGKTYWLDPMVQVTTLSDLSSCVYDLNVRQEILSTGLGTDNPQHILQLKALLESSGSSQVSANREEKENVALAEKSTDDISISTPPCLENADSGNEVISANLLPHSAKEKEPLKEVDAHGDPEPLRTLPSTSLYPEVKWFEKEDTVILTVKLRQVTDPKCTFCSNRLVFSCNAGGKHYVADMELYKDIVRDKSECTLKNGVAVISIQKSKAEMWNKLLKHKHPNVSFDFDHLEDSEDSEGFSKGFSTTKKFYNVVSEDLVSSEYSESDSD